MKYVFTINGFCNDWKFEVGKTYETSDVIGLYGLSYCEKIDDLVEYHNYSKYMVIFEIEDIGDKREINNNIIVTNKIKISRKIEPKEYNELFTRYKFDENNNMIEHVYSDGTEEYLNYDENNNKIEQNYSDGTKESWKYDKNNNKIEHIYCNGDKESWKYDSNNNMIEHIYYDGNKESWKYDSNNNMIEHIKYQWYNNTSGIK